MANLFYVGLLFLFLALGAEAQQSRTIEALHVFEGTKLVRNRLFENRPLQFKDLEAAYQQKQFQDYDGFLEYLFQKSPRLKNNYVLIYRSESQQFSSLENPRVVLFDGGSAFGLSDHPEQKNRRVEILETDPKTYEVSLHEIIFDQNEVRFHAKPAACMSCHGTPAKPLWNPYDFWPNAFGAGIGQFSTQAEADAYDRLLKKSDPTPIFKKIELPQKFDFDTENITYFSQYIHQINLGRWISQNIPQNLELGGFVPALLATANFCTTSALESSPNYAANRLLSYFRTNESFPALPTIEKIGQDVSLNRQGFKKFLDQILIEIFPAPSYLFQVDHNRLAAEVDPYTHLIWTLNAMGLDTSNLTTSLYSNQYLITSPAIGPIDFLTTLYELRPQLLKGLKLESTDFYLGQQSFLRVDCKQLQDISQNTLRSPHTSLWRPSQVVQNSQPVVSRCAKCHVEQISDISGLAPQIPFHKTMDFAKMLRDPKVDWKKKIMDRVRATDRKQMPPGQPLSEREIASLDEYLSALK